MLKRAFAALVGVSLLAPILAAGTATAAPVGNGTGQQAGAKRHCITVVDRIQPRGPQVRVVSKQCTDDPIAQPLALPRAEYLIATFYEDSGFQGASDEVWGDEGPCDSVGYGFSDLSDVLDGWVWDGGISSFTLNSGCNASLIYDDYNFTGNSTGTGPVVPFVGQSFNDNIYSMRTWAHPRR
jgi:hypothetical protein